MSATEQTEVLRDLELVAFRRLGTNRVHFALVLPELQREARYFGAPCTVIESPVSAFCHRVFARRKGRHPARQTRRLEAPKARMPRVRADCATCSSPGGDVTPSLFPFLDGGVL